MERPDWDVRLAKNFWLSEFQCKCGECAFGRHPDDVNLLVVDGVQKMRNYLGVPIYIVHRLPDVGSRGGDRFYTAGSGCRCQAHNRRVGGSNRSRHLKGAAADCWGPPVEDLYQAALRVPQFLNGGIGRYDRGQFVHVDVRGYTARWKG